MRKLDFMYINLIMKICISACFFINSGIYFVTNFGDLISTNNFNLLKRNFNETCNRKCDTGRLRRARTSAIIKEVPGMIYTVKMTCQVTVS